MVVIIMVVLSSARPVATTEIPTKALGGAWVQDTTTTDRLQKQKQKQKQKKKQKQKQKQKQEYFLNCEARGSQHCASHRTHLTTWISGSGRSQTRLFPPVVDSVSRDSDSGLTTTRKTTTTTTKSLLLTELEVLAIPVVETWAQHMIAQHSICRPALHATTHVISFPVQGMADSHGMCGLEAAVAVLPPSGTTARTRPPVLPPLILTSCSTGRTGTSTRNRNGETPLRRDQVRMRTAAAARLTSHSRLRVLVQPPHSAGGLSQGAAAGAGIPSVPIYPMRRRATVGLGPTLMRRRMRLRMHGAGIAGELGSVP